MFDPATGRIAEGIGHYGFKKAGLRRLISIIEPANVASIRVAEKMGMTLEKSASFHKIHVQIYSVANAVTGTTSSLDIASVHPSLV